VQQHILLFLRLCAKLAYGDSPALNAPENAAKKTGFAKVASAFGIPLADFREGKEIICNDTIQGKRFTIANGVLESDGLISLPKLKTQGFLKLTGAVKNQFGCIPGMLKSEFHVKIPRPIDFAKMLVDLNLYIKPRLYIMDGIIAMEGNGPRNGDPRKINVLIFSTDPIALDATVCRIIHVNPEYSFTITQGREAGLGTYLEDEIELLGDPIESFIDYKFNVNRDPIRNLKVGGRLIKVINSIVIPKPYITKNLCKKCGICVKMCPVEPKAVNWNNGNKNSIPTYKYEDCIRCFCCQELCPEGAIKIKKPMIRKLLALFYFS